jgi:hypothetical protein
MTTTRCARLAWRASTSKSSARQETPVCTSSPTNRQTRRAAKAIARHTPKSKYHQIVAVQEVGYAVAKVTAAPDFGYEVHEVVAYIDVGSRAGRSYA